MMMMMIITKSMKTIRGRNNGSDNKQCNGGDGCETQHVANGSPIQCNPKYKYKACIFVGHMFLI